jgi:hypothetical protein
MPDQAQIHESIITDGVKPVFADGFMIAFRIKAKNEKPTEMNFESADVTSGLLELIFIDESQQQALSRVVLTRETAEEVSKGLIESLKKLDEVMGIGGLSKIMPKQENKPRSDVR